MQNRKKIKVFIIAGEVSGDILGAKIMRELPDADFIGVGGENMIAAGLNSLFPMSDLAVMGIIEVVAHARTLTRRISQTVRAIIASRPDVVLTIDSPGFAKSVVEKLRKNSDGKKLIADGLRFHHVVAPQVWAWRSGRAKKYAQIFDKLYAFFVFDVPYFTKYGLDTVAVGHPIADGLIGYQSKHKKINNEKIIAIIPGSRMSEVKRLMPLFQDVVGQLVANGYNDYRFVIPTVETTDGFIREHVKRWGVQPEIIPSKSRYDLYAQTYIAIAASGTVSAELAMLHVPSVIVYKMNPVTVWLARHLLQVKWVSLVNILLNRSVYPECLGPNATTENILDNVRQLSIPSVRENMISGLKSADNLWRRPNGAPAALIAQSVRNSVK